MEGSDFKGNPCIPQIWAKIARTLQNQSIFLIKIIRKWKAEISEAIHVFLRSEPGQPEPFRINQFSHKRNHYLEQFLKDASSEITIVSRFRRMSQAKS